MKYTVEELERLSEIYATAKSRDEVAIALPNRSWCSIRHKANRLGLYFTYPKFGEFGE